MNKDQQQTKRQIRIRKKIRATSDTPRLTVFRSNKHIYAQIVDDSKRTTLVSAREMDTKKSTKTERARTVGMDLAKAAIAKKIKAVVFDKGSYAYHGRVKALAEGAREGGLTF
jgi:large subunit ribosomal protein L18